jgi:hypothetical protein
MALALASWYQAELHVVRVESRFRSQSKRPAGGVADDAVRARVDDFVAAVNVQDSNVETVALAGDPVAAVVDYSRSITARSKPRLWREPRVTPSRRPPSNAGLISSRLASHGGRLI